MIRSLLYVPAHRQRFIDRAHERAADVIVLDLEDSVPDGSKAEARVALPQAIQHLHKHSIPVFVRVNAEPDLYTLDVVAALASNADGLLLPKTSTIQGLSDNLAVIEKFKTTSLKIIPLIEDPLGIINASAIATASPDIYGLMVGGEDLALSMDAQPTPDVLKLPKLLVHLAAKSAGIRSFGLIRSIADFNNKEAIRAAAEEALAFGFDGATCVHPDVVPLLNEAFSPAPDAVSHARALVSYAEQLGDTAGAFTFDGVMIDKPILERARRLLARVSSL